MGVCGRRNQTSLKLFPIRVRPKFAAGQNPPFVMQANSDRLVDSLLPQVAAESASLVPLDRDTILRDPRRAWNQIGRLDLLADGPADRVLGVAREFRSVHGAAGIPGLFAKVGFL